MKQDENQTKIIKDINSDINLLPSLVEKKFKIKKDIENINQEILIYESNIKLLENKENNIMNLNKEKKFELNNAIENISLNKFIEYNFLDLFQENNNTFKSKDITFEIENNKLNLLNAKNEENLYCLKNIKNISNENLNLFLIYNYSDYDQTLL
jgi:hypothetical protein